MQARARVWFISSYWLHQPEVFDDFELQTLIFAQAQAGVRQTLAAALDVGHSQFTTFACAEEAFW